MISGNGFHAMRLVILFVILLPKEKKKIFHFTEKAFDTLFDLIGSRDGTYSAESWGGSFAWGEH